jgi:hypothetical protein
MSQRQEHITSKTLPPFPASERRAFHQDFTTRQRRDATRAKFKYTPDSPDTLSPHPIARRIRKALRADMPSAIVDDLEDAVYTMVLCAGNPISLDAPLAAQFLAAFQRISDFHGERVLLTPEELARFSVLIHAKEVIVSVLDWFDAWQKGGAA